MKLDALFSVITKFGTLKDTTKLYPNANNAEKATIEEAIVKHMVTFNVVLGEIVDQLSGELKGVLSERRHKVVPKDAKMKYFTLEKITSSLTHEEKVKLSQLQVQEFKIKKRVNNLMGKDKNDLENLREETIKSTERLLKELGASSSDEDEM